MSTSDTNIVIPEATNIFVHVINTWIVGIAIASLQLLVPGILGSESSLDTIIFFFAAFVFGSPSFIIGWLFLLLINETRMSVKQKFIGWCIAIFLSIIGNMLLFGMELFSADRLELLCRLYPAAFISLVIRRNKFFRLYQNNERSNGDLS